MLLTSTTTSFGFFIAPPYLVARTRGGYYILESAPIVRYLPPSVKPLAPVLTKSYPGRNAFRAQEKSPPIGFDLR